MAHRRQQHFYYQEEVEEDPVFLKTSSPYLSQHGQQHKTYTSPYYSDGRTPPMQRFIIELYFIVEGWISSRPFTTIITITVIAALLVNWLLGNSITRQQRQQQQHNSFFSLLQSILPSWVLTLLNMLISTWIYFSIFLESVTRLRLHIKTGGNQERRDGSSLRESNSSATIMQRRGVPSSLPDLEELITVEAKATTSSQSVFNQTHYDTQQQKQSRMLPDAAAEELEPTFTDPSKYPAGWLTYHPTYGLIDIKELHRINEIQHMPPQTKVTEDGTSSLQLITPETKMLEARTSRL